MIAHFLSRFLAYKDRCTKASKVSCIRSEIIETQILVLPTRRIKIWSPLLYIFLNLYNLQVRYNDTDSKLHISFANKLILCYIVVKLVEPHNVINNKKNNIFFASSISINNLEWGHFVITTIIWRKN